MRVRLLSVPALLQEVTWTQAPSILCCPFQSLVSLAAPEPLLQPLSLPDPQLTFGTSTAPSPGLGWVVRVRWYSSWEYMFF